jgi:uncharacterized protein YdhG (YjbR/CyaY superfamily)
MGSNDRHEGILLPRRSGIADCRADDGTFVVVDRDPSVDDYLRDVAPERQEVLAAIRNACVAELDGFIETMVYRMPSYERAAEVEVAFASHKQHIALYILRTDVMARHRDRLGRIDTGKGAIRYRNPGQVDLDVIRSMLRATAASTGPVC